MDCNCKFQANSINKANKTLNISFGNFIKDFTQSSNKLECCEEEWIVGEEYFVISKKYKIKYSIRNFFNFSSKFCFNSFNFFSFSSIEEDDEEEE